MPRILQDIINRIASGIIGFVSFAGNTIQSKGAVHKRSIRHETVLGVRCEVSSLVLGTVHVEGKDSI